MLEFEPYSMLRIEERDRPESALRGILLAATSSGFAPRNRGEHKQLGE